MILVFIPMDLWPRLVKSRHNILNVPMVVSGSVFKVLSGLKRIDLA